MIHEKKIGILGGGQLGRMLIEASIPLSLNVSVLDESLEYPAASISTNFYIGNFSDYNDVVQFGLAMDIITVEIESVNTDALKHLQMQGKEIYPKPEVLELINDKGLQKLFYKSNRIPTSDFRLFENKAEVLEAIFKNEISLPFVQKLRKGGYDGRGVSVINSTNDFNLLFDAPSIVEDKVKIKTEMAVIVARAINGEMKAFPMVEMEFHPTANLVEYLFCPSSLSNEIQEKASQISLDLAKKLENIGLLAVELFLDENDNVIVNEIAPRPHNSGHHTIEACDTSQFEQMLKCLLGLPLGDCSLLKPAVMINLLGEEGYNGKAFYVGLDKALAIPGVHPHLYNKKITKPNRKMGHVTIVNENLEEAKRIANEVKQLIKVITK